MSKPIKQSPLSHDAEEAFLGARVSLYIGNPMYGILALRLIPQEREDIKTMCVSHTHLSYNPTFVLELGDILVESGIAHELGHIIQDHLNRRGNRDPRRWNAACDYVVNADIKRDGFELGKDWLYDPKYDDMTADHIYELLPDSNENGDGPAADGGWGALDNMEPGDPADTEDQATQWKIAVVQAAAEAQKMGKLPASMERHLEKILQHKVDWVQKLRRFATEHTMSDESWDHADRRMIVYGYYLPDLHSEAMGTIAIGIDTSGSIDQYTLDKFGAEITAIKNLTKPQRLINIYCDAQVNKVDEFGEYEQPTYQMCGGGGTDFRPPYKHLETMDVRPACFIYLTDGYGRFPEAQPPYPVLWVMTTDVIPPWGEHVRVEA